MATGFVADSFIRPTTVLGRDCINLDDVWSNHPIAYLSISIPEFPNFFMLNGPNGPVGNFSLIHYETAGRPRREGSVYASAQTLSLRLVGTALRASCALRLARNAS